MPFALIKYPCIEMLSEKQNAVSKGSIFVSPSKILDFLNLNFLLHMADEKPELEAIPFICNGVVQTASATSPVITSARAQLIVIELCVSPKPESTKT